MLRLFGLLVLCVLLSGCRGYWSEEPAIHLNPNMDWQSKYKAQTFTEPVPEHTVPWGDYKGFSDRSSREKFGAYKMDREEYFEGRQNGQYVEQIPVSVSMDTLLRGKERYNIHCAVCHGQTGAGNGMVVTRGFVRPVELWDPRLLSVADGYLYDVISNGIRNMPAYGKAINEDDRWAIVTYLRALQKARTGSVDDLPSELRQRLDSENK